MNRNPGIRYAYTMVFAAIIIGVAAGTRAETLVDEFDSNHTYWTNSIEDLSGTIWDGMQEMAGVVDVVDANISYAGELRFHYDGTVARNGSDVDFNVPALYINVTGDFDAELYVPNHPAYDNYRTVSLAAWSNNLTDCVHVDCIAGTTQAMRFRDCAGNYEFKPTVNRFHWMRLVRSGSDFTAYYKDDGGEWTLIGTIPYAGMPDTVRVGLAYWDLETDTGYYDVLFGKFQIETTGGGGAGTVILIQ